jgi:heme exporter protein D
MSGFLAMGGYGFYVWMAYGGTALAIIAELCALRMRRRRALREARVPIADTPTTVSRMGATGGAD